MSTGLVTKEKLLEIIELINEVKRTKLDYEKYKKFLHLILPNQRNGSLLKDEIIEHGSSKIMFVPESVSVVGTFDKANMWAKNNVDVFESMCLVKNRELLELYLKLFVLVHEVEHYNQYLYAEGTLSTGATEVDCAYRGLLQLFLKSEGSSETAGLIKEAKKTISLMSYKTKENDFVLERNANVEAFELLGRIAFYSDDVEMLKIFDHYRRHFIKIGYVNSANGSFYETYKKMYMLQKYNKIFKDSDILEIMDDYDKVRFGLPIESRVREDVLKLRF